MTKDDAVPVSLNRTDGQLRMWRRKLRQNTDERRSLLHEQRYFRRMISERQEELGLR